jgi:hypothetical protein
MQKEADDIGEILKGQYGVLFDAFRDRWITHEQMNRVCFLQIERQRMKGQLRNDRPIKRIESARTDAERIGRQRAIDLNHSDGIWLDDLRHFKNEAGLELSEKEVDWDTYLVTGKVTGNVAQYLSASKRVQVLEDDDGDIPF